MKVSLNTVKQYIDFELPPTDELVDRINSQLGGVEEVIDVHAKYKDAKIVRVVECEKHPNADRLNITKIDAGTGELIQVVCGAPNVRADMWAVWLPPESIVPATYDDKEPFKLGARELRGVMSYGMLAAADELAISSDHEGILEIKESDLYPASRHSELDSESNDSELINNWIPDQVRNDNALQPGQSFAKIFGLDDTIIDIENKMFTHRPDLFGQLGVAREIAGILGHKFTSPDWYLHAPKFDIGEGLELDVFNEADEKVPRFIAVAFKDVEVKPSPLWLQCALVALGSKPINNIVDVTNYVMLLTAQPTHAYDYDKLHGAKLGARMAQEGEKATLLNGKAYTLTADDIVITDGERVVGLGGIMGGQDSEVTNDTKNIVLEVATFDMYAVRKTSMRHGIFTDALTRFNKGQSPLQNDRVLKLLMNFDGMSGTQASNVASIIHFDDCIDNDYLHKVEGRGVTSKFINDRLGLSLNNNQILDLLTNVEFKIVPDEHGLNIFEPFWRTDIEEPEDIVEEVGRLYGFDKLPRELPTRTTKPTPQNTVDIAKQKIRESLMRAGGNEVLTYSFVHEKVLTGANQNPNEAFRLSNALSPDLQYYRISMLPNLLDKVTMNQKAGHDEFMLYEIGKGHHVNAFDDDNLPKEMGRVAGVYATNRRDVTQAAYYNAKHTVEYLLQTVLPNSAIKFVRMDEFDVPDFKPFVQMIAPFTAKRSAVVLIDGKLAGAVGEFHPGITKNFKLGVNTSGFELFLSPFMTVQSPAYTPLSKYQYVERDICFQTSVDTAYHSVVQAAESAEGENEYVIDISPLDIYEPEDHAYKNTTLRFRITSHDKTLTSDDATKLVDLITERVANATGARVV